MTFIVSRCRESALWEFTPQNSWSVFDDSQSGAAALRTGATKPDPLPPFVARTSVRLDNLRNTEFHTSSVLPWLDEVFLHLSGHQLTFVGPNRQVMMMNAFLVALKEAKLASLERLVKTLQLEVTKVPSLSDFKDLFLKSIG